MKSRPISIRFDEDNLLLAQNLSGIKKPQKLVDLLIAEYVKPLKGKPIELPKDYMKVTEPISAINKHGEVVVKDIAKPLSEEAKLEIERLQKEIANPPKNMSISMKLYCSVRESRIKELTSKIPPIPE